MRVFVVVIVVMAFMAVSFLGSSRWGICFESVSAAQRFLPSGRDRRRVRLLHRAVANRRQRRVAGNYLS
jgi:hypothetical protein